MATKKTNRATRLDPVLNGSDQLRQDMRYTMDAAVGVAFLRTCEPFDAVRAVEDMCVADNLPLRVWNIIRGWHVVDVRNPDLPVTAVHEDCADPMPALLKVYDTVCPKPGAARNVNELQLFPAPCVAVMMWPDVYLKNLPPMRALLAELSKELATNLQRLFLLVPPGFEVPSELAEMVPIIDYALPTQEELLAIYELVRTSDITDGQRDRTRNFTQEDALAACSAGAGMTRSEFQTALCFAYVAQERKDRRAFADFKREIMTRKVQLVKRSEVLEVLPPVDMDEVGGLENLKEWIEKRARCYTQEARDAGVDIPNGIALIGPPGTGKSLGAKACGSALQIPVIKFDVSRVFGSLVGESEARMSKALQMIDAMAPCVCLVDEVDKVFNANGGNGDSGTSTRVLGKILTHMQESKAPIFWVLTANRVNNLPPEMLRKGRLDEIFSVTTPTEDEREAILRIHLSKRGFAVDRIDLTPVVEASNGYVGGELEAAVVEAAVEAFYTDTPMSAAHMVEAISQMKPLSVSFRDDFAAMEAWAENHARPSSAVRKKQAAAAGRLRTRNRPRAVAGNAHADDDMAG